MSHPRGRGRGQSNYKGNNYDPDYHLRLKTGRHQPSRPIYSERSRGRARDSTGDYHYENSDFAYDDPRNRSDPIVTESALSRDVSREYLGSINSGHGNDYYGVQYDPNVNFKRNPRRREEVLTTPRYDDGGVYQEPIFIHEQHQSHQPLTDHLHVPVPHVDQHGITLYTNDNDQSHDDEHWRPQSDWQPPLYWQGQPGLQPSAPVSVQEQPTSIILTTWNTDNGKKDAYTAPLANGTGTSRPTGLSLAATNKNPPPPAPRTKGATKGAKKVESPLDKKQTTQPPAAPFSKSATSLPKATTTPTPISKPAATPASKQAVASAPTSTPKPSSLSPSNPAPITTLKPAPPLASIQASSQKQPATKSVGALGASQSSQVAATPTPAPTATAAPKSQQATNPSTSTFKSLSQPQPAALRTLAGTGSNAVSSTNSQAQATAPNKAQPVTQKAATQVTKPTQLSQPTNLNTTDTEHAAPTASPPSRTPKQQKQQMKDTQNQKVEKEVELKLEDIRVELQQQRLRMAISSPQNSPQQSPAPTLQQHQDQDRRQKDKDLMQPKKEPENEPITLVNPSDTLYGPPPAPLTPRDSTMAQNDFMTRNGTVSKVSNQALLKCELDRLQSELQALFLPPTPEMQVPADQMERLGEKVQLIKAECYYYGLVLTEMQKIQDPVDERDYFLLAKLKLEAQKTRVWAMHSIVPAAFSTAGPGLTVGPTSSPMATPSASVVAPAQVAPTHSQSVTQAPIASAPSNANTHSTYSTLPKTTLVASAAAHHGIPPASTVTFAQAPSQVEGNNKRKADDKEADPPQTKVQARPQSAGIIPVASTVTINQSQKDKQSGDPPRTKTVVVSAPLSPESPVTQESSSRAPVSASLAPVQPAVATSSTTLLTTAQAPLTPAKSTLAPPTNPVDTTRDMSTASLPKDPRRKNPKWDVLPKSPSSAISESSTPGRDPVPTGTQSTTLSLFNNTSTKGPHPSPPVASGSTSIAAMAVAPEGASKEGTSKSISSPRNLRSDHQGVLPTPSPVASQPTTPTTAAFPSSELNDGRERNMRMDVDQPSQMQISLGIKGHSTQSSTHSSPTAALFHKRTARDGERTGLNESLDHLGKTEDSALALTSSFMGAGSSSSSMSSSSLAVLDQLTVLRQDSIQQRIQTETLRILIESEARRREQVEEQVLRYQVQLQEQRIQILEKDLECKRSEALLMACKAREEVRVAREELAKARMEKVEAKMEVARGEVERQKLLNRIQSMEARGFRTVGGGEDGEEEDV